MAYLGNDLQVAYSTYKILDNISSSFNGSTTSFALRVGGVAPVPAPINEQQVLISVGGVIQQPDPSGVNGFKLSGGNIVFSSAPATGEAFFGVILAGADYINVGANFPTGSVSAPSITFDAEPNTGFYRVAANQVGLAIAGVNAATFTSTGLTVNSQGVALLNTAQTFSGGQRAAITTLTDAATVAVDMSLNNNFTVTLGGNRSLGSPTNQVAGQSGSIFLVQDATGSRTLSYASDYKFPNGSAPTLSTTANAVDRIDYIIRASGNIHCVFTAAYA